MVAKMADKAVVINELLFFVQNKFGCKPFTFLQGILVNYYSDESIGSAKKKLFDIGVRLLGNNAGKFKDHQPGDSKKRLDT